MAAISLGDFSEILDAIEKMPGVGIKDNKSTTRTKKYILEGDNRLELSSKIHEMLDRKRIKYSF